MLPSSVSKIMIPKRSDPCQVGSAGVNATPVALPTPPEQPDPWQFSQLSPESFTIQGGATNDNTYCCTIPTDQNAGQRSEQCPQALLCGSIPCFLEALSYAGRSCGGGNRRSFPPVKSCVCPTPEGTPNSPAQIVSQFIRTHRPLPPWAAGLTWGHSIIAHL